MLKTNDRNDPAETVTPMLRAGIIGCGDVARQHMEGYLKSERFEVVALADVSAQAMRGFDRRYAGSAAYHPQHFIDYKELLKQANPEVVSVCVWDKDHAAVAVAAAASGAKAIICEKPMADSLGAAAEIIAACRASGVKLVVGHQRRFLPSFNLAKRMIADREIGDVRMMTAYAHDGLPNFSSHQTDIFRYLLGDVECTWVMGSVERETDRWARATRIEDKALAAFGFASGAQAMIFLELTPEWGWTTRIYGTEGMIECGLTDVRVMNAKSRGWKVHEPASEFARPGEDRFEYIEGNAAQARELADWISGAAPGHRGEAMNGYKALEMVHAVYESARTHTQVWLPIKTRVNPLELMVAEGHLQVRYPGKYDVRARPPHSEATEGLHNT
ncbi:MAG: Gfo/Idh/MocA family oxidoreductase [SAR202 cluster bacterium]|nr:Gfo/Idh/MocA family oxidoreductase [SAR202 cluster bacterium]